MNKNFTVSQSVKRYTNIMSPKVLRQCCDYMLRKPHAFRLDLNYSQLTYLSFTIFHMVQMNVNCDP